MTSKPSSPHAPRAASYAAAGLLALLTLSGAACGGSGAGPTDPGGVLTTAAVEGSSSFQVNSERSRAGLDPLLVDPLLSDIARDYSRQMRDQGFVSHHDSDGTAVDGRLRSHGVRFTLAGENVATVGDTTDPAGDAHRGFMASEPHRANILDGRYTAVGVGVATDGEQWWLAQIFICD